jgi:hypothetical protein
MYKDHIEIQGSLSKMNKAFYYLQGRVYWATIDRGR